MLIDWFTVGAQLLNFVILAWLLKRLLYKPINDAIDARERQVAKELADADASMAEARRERDEFQRRNAEFDAQRAALMSQAAREAQAQGRRLIEQAQAAADALSARRREALSNDAENLKHALGQGAQRAVFAVVRRVLSDLAAASLEERMSTEFLRRLREMDGQDREGLKAAPATESEPLLVRSAFDLPEEQRAAIRAALEEILARKAHVRFESAPEIVSGIELTAKGQKFAWSIAEYLRSLEQSIGELLEERR